MLEIFNLKSALIGPMSLSVARGECVALMGPSGSGKSLFLRAIVDLDPNEGDVSLDGMQRAGMAADRWRRRVALVPSESGWWADQVAAHFEATEHVRRLLQELGLAEALEWDVGRLSSGERQRLALVRALAGQPDALLLDEPTAALDEVATEAVETVIAEQCARGAAVIVVTHSRAQAQRISTRRFLMERGRLSVEPVEAP